MVCGKMFFYMILTLIICFGFRQMLYLLVSKGRCYCLADVNALYGYGRCYSQEVDGIPLLFEWQMLLPFFVLADILYVAVYCNCYTG